MTSRGLLIALICFLAGCGGDEQAASPPEAPEAEFKMVDATPASGLVFATKSGTSQQAYICDVKSTGVGLLDYDSDGLLDILLVAGSDLERAVNGKPGFGVRLYRNTGSLRFEDKTSAAGLDQVNWGWACAPACADIDGDGDDDLYITQIGANILLLNEEGVFKEARGQAADAGWGTSSAFADIDRDGDLDLYVCNYLAFDFSSPPEDGKDGLSCRWRNNKVMCGPKGLPPQADRVYRNDGGGRFSDMTDAWGVAALPPSYGLGVLAGDFDRKGGCKLYVANDGMANFYLRWDTGTRRLIEEAWDVGLAVSEDGAPQAGMGLDAADLNGDGIEDFVCTNFSSEVNNIYLSDGDGFYQESSATSGIALSSLPTLGWGTALRDFNLDGRCDLFVANGHVYPQAAVSGTGTDYAQFNQLYAGQEGGRFELVSRLKHPGMGVKKVSRGVACGDLDNDGDVDLVVCNLNARPTLLENRTRSGTDGPAFTGVTLIGTGANTQGLGALVVSEADGVTLTVRRQASFQSSNGARLVLAGALGEVRVNWTDGTSEVFEVRDGVYNELKQGEGRK